MLRPKKRLGQHFLSDPAIAQRIVDSASLSPGAVVVELGAGRGILTRPLADSGACLMALELDEPLAEELVAYFKDKELLAEGDGVSKDVETGPGRGIEIIQADFTGVSLSGLLSSRGFDRCVLFGNIPYNLTRHVLFSFLLDELEVIERAVLMVQREVGERIISPPGSRVYGITSVLLQSFYNVRPLFRVSAGSFFPRPKVESVVLEFMPLVESRVRKEELKIFKQFVKNVFQQRRKTIHNSMKAFYTLSEVQLKKVHAATGIDLKKRPEVLSIEELLLLSRTLEEVIKV
jgi:16S rRNA (adenine1518-N6/adenine1519-N6)-dimethyltransferase